MIPFPLVNPDSRASYFVVACPLRTCRAAAGEPCREPDGSPVVGAYGASTANLHRARAIKARLVGAS